MMYYNLLIFITLFLSISCTSNEKQLNEANNYQIEISSSEILSEEQLIPITKELLLIEASIYFKSNRGWDVKQMTTAYYNQLFKKYNVTPNIIMKSFHYHLLNNKKTSHIFAEIVNTLIVESDSIRKTITNKDSEINNNTKPNKKKPTFFGTRQK